MRLGTKALQLFTKVPLLFVTFGGDWGLVASLVFKTRDTSKRRVVGSIPIRLRHPCGSTR